MTILERAVAVEVPEDGWTWVRLGDRVAVAPLSTSHEDLAEADKLFDPNWSDRKFGVSDGGLLFEGHNELTIPTHFTDSTTVMEVQQAIDSGGDVDATRKRVRRKSGQRIADLTGKRVLVQYGDETQEVLTLQAED